MMTQIAALDAGAELALAATPQAAYSAMVRHYNKGDYAATERLGQGAIVKFPDAPQLLDIYAAACFQRRNYKAGVAAAEQLVRLQPDHIDMRVNIAVGYQDFGRNDAALAVLDDVLVRAPDDVAALTQKASLLAEMERWEEAAAACQAGLELAPGDPELVLNLVDFRHRQGDLDDAERDAICARAIAAMPDLPKAQVALGEVLGRMSLFEQGATAFRKALAQAPEDSSALCGLGSCLRELHDYSQAMQLYRQAMELQPDRPRAYDGLALTLGQTGDVAGSIAIYREALTRFADHTHMKMNMSFALLRHGDWAEGWAYYENRLAHEPFIRKYIANKPPGSLALWTPENDCRRPVVYHEQGLGDALMMARFLPSMLAANEAVYMFTTPKLAPLFTRSFPDVKIIENREVLESEDYDSQLALMSLGAHFVQDEADIAAAATPYLKADAAMRDALRAQFNLSGDKPIVGLVWYSDSHNAAPKNAPADIFMQALAGLELQYVSLQYGDVAENLAAMSAPYEMEIVNAGATLGIDDMAALSSACDLVVCVDTMNAHLAGGLGVDCFVVLPFSADWRWHDGRDDTPWYAGMRLFRQPAPADWQGVVAPLRAAVQEKFKL